MTARNPYTTFSVAVDPGVSTGLVIIRGDGFVIHREQGAPSILDDFTVRFPFLLNPGSDVLFACERFVVTVETARRSAQPVAQQVVGVVTQLCRINNWKLHLQTPADAKSFVSNDLLRKLKIISTAQDVGQRDANDVNDAARHALLNLAQRRASMFAALLDDTIR